MQFALWMLVIGILLVAIALADSVLRRLPASAAMLYLLAGVALSPLGFGLAALEPIAVAGLMERAAEVAVLVSLFTSGLKLRAALSERRWRIVLRLASVSMIVTIGLIAVAATLWLDLSIGAAILLGAILAPTDPVLASDVQLEDHRDRDRLRFSLTGEGGLNDGAAFPFVMLGLGLLGTHDLGSFGWRWLAVDVVWAVLGGLAIGALLGHGVGRLVLYLRQAHREAVGLDDFLALGLIALSYSFAVLVHAYGFLAVFAAGLALRRIERRSPQNLDERDVTEGGLETKAKETAIATRPETAPAYLAHAVLGFNQRLERIVEVAIVVMIGVMLPSTRFPAAVLWLAPLLFLVIRPAAVALGLAGLTSKPMERRLIAWFGIRGVGSIYYVMYAIGHGLSDSLHELFVGVTLWTVVGSIAVHGISVTPLMRRYARAPPSRD